ncbi:MAG: succinoglycan biosynthesis transport protein ExoP [Psychromonas sp.]|jgi:succinoglycan biosynthesis transport protein ExoP
MNDVEGTNSHTNQRLQYNQTFGQEELIDLGQYWLTIKRTKWGIIFITFCCLIIGGLIASSAVPIYRATSKILADPQQPFAEINELNVSSSLVSLYYQTQYEIIQSRNIAETVVDKLNLVEKYKIKLAQLPIDETLLGDMLRAIKTKVFALGNKKPKVSLAPTDAEIRLMLTSNIMKNTIVSGGNQSQIINISYTSDNAKQSSEIINALSDAYIQFGLESRLSEVKNTQGWLSKQYAQLKTQLQNSEGKLSGFRNQQGMFDTSQQQSVANTQLQILNRELIRAQTSLSAAEVQFLAIQNVKSDSESLYAIGPVLNNGTTNDMVKDEARLSQKVNELSERYGVKHPKMIAARSELNSAQNSLKVAVNKVLQNIERDYRLAQAQVNNMNDLIVQNASDIQSLQGNSFAVVSLEREVENNRRVVESFQSHLMEADIKSEFTESNVQIIDRATVPKVPLKPNKKVIMLLAGACGVILGVVMALMRAALNNTFKTPNNIENKLKLPALGITPIVKKRKGKSNVAPESQYLDDSRSFFSESIDSIRTSLLFSNIEQPPKTILVTSASSGEGKSTLAINLAAAFSQLGKTLLLEVDLRKPSIAKNLAIQGKLGLTDLMMGTITSADAGFKTDINGKLSVITCGSVPRNPLELLSSQNFDKVFVTFKNHFDYIILDGPPTLPVSDSCILANKVDGVIFAVKADETKIKVAESALSRLKKSKVNVIGAVLTIADKQKMAGYGEHYHYSGEYYGVSPVKEPTTDST